MRGAGLKSRIADSTDVVLHRLIAKCLQNGQSSLECNDFGCCARYSEGNEKVSDFLTASTIFIDLAPAGY
jgi:hypothetical protein